ncbi:hypothetical protein SDC9_164879 [bioreactor metagenome]|uniref:Uncharacterized protein n=1 Tax=bioreactor metagenome TaxID=1076179 RepID=A0A645FSU2_9ZZZZ
MVDVVRATDAVRHTDQVGDRRNHVVRDDMPRNEVIIARLEQRLELVLRHAFAVLERGLEGRQVDVLVDARFRRIKFQPFVCAHKVVADHLHAVLANL